MKRILTSADLNTINACIVSGGLNITHLAKQLGVSRQVIQYHVRKLKTHQPVTIRVLPTAPPAYRPKPAILIEIEAEEAAQAAEQRKRFAAPLPPVPYTGGMPPDDIEQRIRKVNDLPRT